jgi:hypothetical protein
LHVKKKMKGSLLVFGPTLVKEISANLENDQIISFAPEIQISVHSIASSSVLNELNLIFKNVKWTKDNTTFIMTMQKSNYELVRFDTDVDNEKDFLLENVRYFCLKYFYISFRCVFFFL